jgi:hypothetical protein
MIGGWSAGGVYAYEVSRQLLEAGETSLGLIVIDMRVSKSVLDGLKATMGFIEKAGLAVGINRRGTPNSPLLRRLKQHLLSTLNALMAYDPIPMDPNRRPGSTSIVWAKLGHA